MRRAVQISIAFQRQTGHEHPGFRIRRANYVGLLRAIGRTEEQIHQQMNELIEAMRPEGS